MSNNLEYEIAIRNKQDLDKFAQNMGLIKGKTKNLDQVIDLISHSTIDREKLIEKLSKYPISEKKRSQYNKNKSGSSVTKRTNPKRNTFNELLLYTCLNNKRKVAYADIMRFLLSFGLSSEEIHLTISRKIVDEDVILISNDEQYKQIIKYLIDTNIFKFPHPLKIEDAYHKFIFLGYNHPDEFNAIVQNINRRYPDFISFSPIKSGSRTDLITIRQFFSNDTIFIKYNRWSD